MPLGDLEFKAEDATGVVGTKRLLPSGNWETVKEMKPVITIDEANRLLKERLEKGEPKVDAIDGISVLVCIEEVGE